MVEIPAFWRKCSSCKKEIGFHTKYWVCNVSTCNRKRTGLIFCNVSCWDAHVPLMNHRDSWAEERTSPSKNAYLKELEQQANETQAGSVPKSHEQRVVSPLSTTKAPVMGHATEEESMSEENGKEVLVVVSKMKNYIRETSQMNTSGEVADILSDRIRQMCDEAVMRARQDGRKTVMARDFEK